MIFGPDHYVPILKVKRGEKKALQTIATSIQSRITPLLEIVERTNKSIDEHLDNAFRDLGKAVAPYRRCLLDAREIASDGPIVAAKVFKMAASEGILFTPVTGITRTADVAAAIENQENGIAIRLTRQEMEAGNLASKLQEFIVRYGLSNNQVDLIMDCGPVEDLVTIGIKNLVVDFLNAIPNHNSWRTFTISTCSFPKSMGVVNRNSAALVERSDWKAWRNWLYTRRKNLGRLPTYSDSSIQHPSGVEGFDPRLMQVSATIRYTLKEDWLLLKGESTRNISPSIQFPSLATQIIYGQHHVHFAGEDHCAGCESMKAAADGVVGYGSAEVWRRLGTIHHITMVVEGLNDLSWP